VLLAVWEIRVWVSKERKTDRTEAKDKGLAMYIGGLIIGG